MSITKCLVTGTLQDSLGNAVPGASVSVFAPSAFWHDSGILISGVIDSTTTASDGTWSLAAIETASCNQALTFQFQYSDGVSGQRLYKVPAVVPNQSTVTLYSLVGTTAGSTTTPLGVQYGGTGLSSLPANAVLLGEGAGTLGSAPPSTLGYLLTDNGPGVNPSFQALSVPGSALPAFTGDVTKPLGSVVQTLAATSNATLATLSGLTSAASLATVGTISSGTWHGTAVDATRGGLGIDTHLSTGVPTASSGTWSVSAQLPAAQFPALSGDVTTSAGSLTSAIAATTNSTLATLSGLTSAASLATVGTVTSGTWSATAIALNKGGTGQTTKAPAFDALQPMSTLGDLIYGGASGTGTRLAGDTSNTRKFLRSLSSGGTAAAPVWDTIQAADVPTLNQNTSGTAAGLSATLAIGSGGTGQVTQQAALNALSPAGATNGQVIAYNGSNWVAQTVPAGTKNYLTAITTSNGTNAGNGNFEFGNLTGWNWAYIGGLSNGLPIQTPTFSSTGVGNALYLITITTSTTCAVGDQYANNGQTFTVIWPLTAATGTSFYATGTGDPLASGTLTRSVGSGTASVVYTAFVKQTAAVVSSGQLSGSYSMSVAHNSATVLGIGACSSAFFIDNEDQAKVLTYKFYYSVQSGAANANWSGTSSNSFAVGVYDVTNSAWLNVAGAFNLVQSSGTGVATGTFQTAATTAQLRFVIYNANATSGAITYYLDDVYVGPQTAPMGPAMTDWASWTPTGTWSTNTTYTGWYRRVGDSIQMIIKLALAGAPTSASLTVTLPNSWSIDTTKLPASPTNVTFGNVYGNGATHPFVGVASYSSATAIGVNYYLDGSTASIQSAAAVTQAAPYTFANNDYIYVYTTPIPITGWSSNTAMSSDTDTRVVSARAHISADRTPGTSQINYDTVDWDTHGAITTGASWKFVAPVTGYYEVTGVSNVSTGAGGSLALYKNGSVYSALAAATSGVANTTEGFATQVQLNAGDSIDLRPNTTGSTFSSANAGIFNNVSIKRLSGPAVVAATESVNARYHSATATVSGSASAVSFTTKDFDSHNAYSGSTYTCPVSGKYQVNAGVIGGGTWSLNGNLYLYLYVGGSLYASDGVFAGGAEGSMSALISDIVNCSAGTTIQMQISSTATSPTLQASTSENFFSIARVGN